MNAFHITSLRRWLSQVRRPSWASVLATAIVLLAFAVSVLPRLGAGGGPTAQYAGADGGHALKIVVSHAQIGGELSDYPVYLDLGALPKAFWDNVAPGCGGIVITDANGKQSLPYKLTSCDVAARTGALQFTAPALSPSSDTYFYVSYGKAVNVGAAPLTGQVRP